MLILSLFILSFVLVVIIISYIKLHRRKAELEAEIRVLKNQLNQMSSTILENAREQFEKWKQKELEVQKKAITEAIEGQYKARLEEMLRLKAEELQKVYQQLFEEWKQKELEERLKELEANLLKRYEAEFQKWKQEEEEKIRKDAILRSASTILGRVGEQLAPILFLSNYGINPKDVRFIGTPVDFIVFKGLAEGKPEEIVFIEVKSGQTQNLTSKERQIKKLIEDRRVSWLTFYTLNEVKKLNKKITGEENSHYGESIGEKGI